MKLKFSFDAYYSEGLIGFKGRGKDGLGYFYRGESTCLFKMKDMGIQDCFFRIALVLPDEDSWPRYKHYEVFEFWHKCDIKNYIKVIGDDDDDQYEVIDYDKLIKDAGLEKTVEYLKGRIIKKRNYKFKKGVKFLNSTLKLEKDSEFIAVNDSDYYVSEQNGVPGLELWFLDDKNSAKNNNKNSIQYPVIDISIDWEEGNCSYNIYKKLINHPNVKNGKYKNADSLIFQSSKEEKKDIFYNFFNEKDCYSIFNEHLDYLLRKEGKWSFLPYSLTLHGGKFYSSKKFITKENRNKEIMYLRKMQPIDIKRDLLERDWSAY